MDVAIIDYGVGNLRSVQKAIEHEGHTAVIASDPAVIRDAPRVILPGVGAFAGALGPLRETGLDAAVHEAIAAGKPVLGICVGMQLLMERSYENGEWSGLGVFAGDVVRFEVEGLKVPQIGWNAVESVSTSPLLNGIPPDLLFYFVHSYYCRPADEAWVAGWTSYGVRYASVLSRGNVHAAQFHPEKSGRAGLAFLRNFAEMPA